jgi:hypothetical protein
MDSDQKHLAARFVSGCIRKIENEGDEDEGKTVSVRSLWLDVNWTHLLKLFDYSTYAELTSACFVGQRATFATVPLVDEHDPEEIPGPATTMALEATASLFQGREDTPIVRVTAPVLSEGFTIGAAGFDHVQPTDDLFDPWQPYRVIETVFGLMLLPPRGCCPEATEGSWITLTFSRLDILAWSRP